MKLKGEHLELHEARVKQEGALQESLAKKAAEDSKAHQDGLTKTEEKPRRGPEKIPAAAPIKED